MNSLLRHLPLLTLFVSLASQAEKSEFSVDWILSTVTTDRANEEKVVVHVINQHRALPTTEFGGELVHEINLDELRSTGLHLPERFARIQFRIFYFNRSRLWAGGYHLLDEDRRELEYGSIDLDSPGPTPIYCSASFGKNDTSKCLYLTIFPRSKTLE